jgi:hypothetical protein
MQHPHADRGNAPRPEYTPRGGGTGSWGRDEGREAACPRGRQSKIKRALVDQNQRIPQLVDGSVSAG